MISLFPLTWTYRLIVCDPEEINRLIEQHYGKDESTLADLLGDISSEGFENLDEAKESELIDAANETPVIRFVNLVLQQAVRAQASDIHFEPFEDEFRIRYRVDGALYEMSPPPKSLALPVISRVKVISELNIAEHRVPQDGRIRMTIAGRPVDLRVSTLPTQFGESVVLRVLDQSAVNLDLDNLGLPENIKEGIRVAVRRPNGIFIVTGPTGSGKTTTLYSALREINVIDTKILTAEDPVEYEIEGIMQVPVNHKVGLDFARALRAFLRQDPDKIMVGEIRDIETARIAVQASSDGARGSQYLAHKRCSRRHYSSHRHGTRTVSAFCFNRVCAWPASGSENLQGVQTGIQTKARHFGRSRTQSARTR